MRLIMLSAALAATALVGSYASASAQGVGVEIYAGPNYYDESYYSYRYVERGPRAYRRYYSEPVDDDADVVVRRSGGCGTYYYWDGDRCVDARIRRGY
jgi:hypothetical protein